MRRESTEAQRAGVAVLCDLEAGCGYAASPACDLGSLVIVATADEEGWDSTFAQSPHAPPVIVSTSHETV